MSNRALALLGVFVAALLVHLPAREGEFLFFDDGRFVVRNTAIDSLENPARFFTDLETTASADAGTSDIYRPVRTLSYAVITKISGKSDARGFHAASILVHALAAAVLAAVLLEAGLKLWAACLGALLFAVHPVTVEVTAWVCSLGDAWCGLFSLLAVLLYARDHWLLAHVPFVLALLSKEHAVVVPGLWLAWDFFCRPSRLKDVVRSAAWPGLLIAIGFLVLRHELGAQFSQVDEPLGGSLGRAVLTMLSGIGFYAATILLPSGPTFQARVEPSVLGVVCGVAVLGALVFALLKGERRTRLGAAWFLIALVPVSNLFATLKIPTADRFLYLPAMGLALMAGDWAQRRAGRAVAWIAPVTLVLLVALTARRIGDFRNDRALAAAWQRVDPKHPSVLWADASAKAQAALAEMRSGNFAKAELLVDEAMHHYSLFVVNEKPENSIQVFMEMGDLLYEWGRWNERIDQRNESITAYGNALERFLFAHELQVRGRGRIVKEEVERAAAAAAALCIRLAEAGNPNLSKTVKTGFEMLRFLETEFGQDVRFRFAQLLFAYSFSIRGEDPAKARRGFDQVLEALDQLAAGGGAQTFLRAQAILHRSALRDKDPDRAGLERAYDLFVQVASQDRDLRLRALYSTGKVCRVIGQLFDDAAMHAKAKRILESIPEIAKKEGLRISGYLAREIAGELKLCVSR